MDWWIGRVPFDHPDAERMRSAQRRELDERYGNEDHEPGETPTADSVPVFLVARTSEGEPIACGGLRPLLDETAGPGSVEVKRMYVTPAARGSGVAVAVLRALEEEAGRLGARRVVLETGTLQPEAIRFYEREGYERIPLFGPYIGAEESLCFERKLG